MAARGAWVNVQTTSPLPQWTRAHDQPAYLAATHLPAGPAGAARRLCYFSWTRLLERQHIRQVDWQGPSLSLDGIRLARLEGLPVKEVARRMHRSEKATSVLLVRAQLKLKTIFGDTESLHLPQRSLEENR